MKHLDLFSGIGGFSLAARSLGIETVQFVEINPYCCHVLRKNFPTIPIHRDIRTFHAKPNQFDLITGGSPCQDLSIAGKRAGITGTRSGLWFEMLRVIEILPVVKLPGSLLCPLFPILFVLEMHLLAVGGSKAHVSLSLILTT